MSNVYNHIVIGAGIIGSSSAYHLSKSSNNVLLIEQYSLPHSRGGSHGQSRAFRNLHKNETVIEINKESLIEWKKLEKESEAKLFEDIDSLYYEERPYTDLMRTIPILDKNGIEYEKPSLEEIALRFPQLKLNGDYLTILEKNCGILKADRCVKAFQDAFKKNSGTIIDECKLIRIKSGEIIEIETNKEKFFCNNLCICTGAWSSKILKEIDLTLPIKPLKVFNNYWKEKNFGEFSSKKNFLMGINKTKLIYFLPSLEYPGFVKVNHHRGEECDADNRDFKQSDKFEEELIEFVKNTFPTLEPKPSIKEACIYANTPDEECILDYHPNYKNIIIATGFSGTGFKKAPVIGKLVSKMAQGLKPHHNIEHFSLNRFKKNNIIQ